MRLQYHRTVGPRSFAGLILLFAIPAAIAAELFPYSLPSQQRMPTAPSNPAEQRAVRPAIDEAYYDKFKRQAKSLKPDQRAELRQTLAQKRDQAIDARRLDEAQHYRTLVRILDTTK